MLAVNSDDFCSLAGNVDDHVNRYTPPNEVDEQGVVSRDGEQRSGMPPVRVWVCHRAGRIGGVEWMRLSYYPVKGCYGRKKERKVT